MDSRSAITYYLLSLIVEMGRDSCSAIILSEHTNSSIIAMSGSDDDANHESGGDNDLSKEADEKRLLFDMKGSKNQSIGVS
jgi:hypothetical protein